MAGAEQSYEAILANEAERKQLAYQSAVPPYS
jgi:hypothetical protein